MEKKILEQRNMRKKVTSADRISKALGSPWTFLSLGLFALAVIILPFMLKDATIGGLKLQDYGTWLQGSAYAHRFACRYICFPRTGTRPEKG